MDSPPPVCRRWLSFAARRAGRSVLVMLASVGHCTLAVPMHDADECFPRPVWARSYARRGIVDLERMLAAR